MYSYDTHEQPLIYYDYIHQKFIVCSYVTQSLVNTCKKKRWMPHEFVQTVKNKNSEGKLIKAVNEWPTDVGIIKSY